RSAKIQRTAALGDCIDFGWLGVARQYRPQDSPPPHPGPLACERVIQFATCSAAAGFLTRVETSCPSPTLGEEQISHSCRERLLEKMHRASTLSILDRAPDDA